MPNADAYTVSGSVGSSAIWTMPPNTGSADCETRRRLNVAPPSCDSKRPTGAVFGGRLPEAAAAEPCTPSVVPK